MPTTANGLRDVPQTRVIITWYERVQGMCSRSGCIPLMVTLGSHTLAGGLRDPRGPATQSRGPALRDLRIGGMCWVMGVLMGAGVAGSGAERVYPLSWRWHLPWIVRVLERVHDITSRTAAERVLDVCAVGRPEADAQAPRSRGAPSAATALASLRHNTPFVLSVTLKLPLHPPSRGGRAGAGRNEVCQNHLNKRSFAPYTAQTRHRTQ